MHRRRRQLRDLLGAVKGYVPHGRGLPDELWEARHAWMLRILWAHAPLLFAVALAYGYDAYEAAEYALGVGALTLLASYMQRRRARALLAAFALLTCSALLVHITGGLIEAHFHFFVLMTVLAFYEDWAVYGLAVSYVLTHLVLVGALMLGDRYPVFEHAAYPDTSSWVWVGVHGAFISASALANVLLWKLNERFREQAGRESSRRSHAEAVTGTLSESLTPDALPDLGATADLAARYLPGEGPIGGDFYEVLVLDDGRIGIGLGDVSGHGVGAAVLTARLRHTLRAYALDGLEPAAVMDKLERALGTDSSATCCYMVIDLAAGTVTSSLAGHLPPAVRHPDGSVHALTLGLSVPLAGLGVPHEQHTYPLPAGSTVVVFSDGLVERRGESLDIGLWRLREAVADSGGDPWALCEELPVVLLAGQRQTDDVALVALRTAA